MNWTEEESLIAKRLLEEGKKYKEISQRIGRSYSSVKNHISKRYGITQDDFNYLRKKEFVHCLQCDTEIKNKIHNGKDRKFCNPSCNAKYNNIRRERKSKICPNCKGKFNKHNKFCSKKCYLENIRVLAWNRFDSGKLRDDDRKLIRKLLIEKEGNSCKICKKTKWMGKDIPLIVDHIDGNPGNNYPDNMRMICPNCDAQLPTYMGRNRKNSMKTGRERRRKTNSI